MFLCVFILDFQVRPDAWMQAMANNKKPLPPSPWLLVINVYHLFKNSHHVILECAILVLKMCYFSFLVLLHHMLYKCSKNTNIIIIINQIESRQVLIYTMVFVNSILLNFWIITDSGNVNVLVLKDLFLDRNLLAGNNSLSLLLEMEAIVFPFCND